MIVEEMKASSSFAGPQTMFMREAGDVPITVSLQGVLDTGKKLSDDNTIGKEEIQQRLAQFVDHWKELKQLAAARYEFL